MTFGRRESAAELNQRVKGQRTQAAYLPREPRFRFFVEVLNASQIPACERLARELEAQSYGHWELYFFAANEKFRAPLEKKLRRHEDERLKVETSFSADGCDYVGWLKPETTLSPVALFFLAHRALEAPDSSTHVIYWNAVGLGPAGNRIAWRVRRPSFSPYALRNGNYLGDDWVVSATVLATPGLTEKLTSPHEFLLSVADGPTAWLLEPTYLTYHRGEPPGPVDSAVTLSRGKKKRALTVVVCFRDKSEWTAKAVRSLLGAAEGVSTDFLLVDNQSQPSEREALEKSLADLGAMVRFATYDRPFNFAAMHNWVLGELVTNENVLLLNNDVFWSYGAVADVLDTLRAKDVATVGIPLRFPNGQPQHLGFKVSRAVPPRLFRVEPLQAEGALAKWGREVFANTFAACFVKRSIFLNVGGLDELEMANGFGDVAFSLECLSRGYRNLFYAAASAIHLESGSRGRNYEYWEEAALQRRYPELLQRMADEDFSIDFPGPMDWISPLLSGVKEALRDRGGLLEPVRAVVKGLFARGMVR